MNFKTFQSNCKYAQYGLKQDTVRDFELTCRKSERVPKGCSWGVCDEAHCPHFGIMVKSGVATDIETGETLFSFDNCRIVIST